MACPLSGLWATCLTAPGAQGSSLRRKHGKILCRRYSMLRNSGNTFLHLMFYASINRYAADFKANSSTPYVKLDHHGQPELHRLAVPRAWCEPHLARSLDSLFIQPITEAPKNQHGIRDALLIHLHEGTHNSLKSFSREPHCCIRASTLIFQDRASCTPQSSFFLAESNVT